MPEGMDWVLCPHCRGKIKDLWDYDGLTHDLDSITTQCDNCNGPVKIKVTIEYRYSIETAAAST